MRSIEEVARDVEVAASTVDWACSAIHDGGFDDDEVSDRLSFAATDLLVAAESLREIARGRHGGE